MKRLLLAATLTVASLSANATKTDEKQEKCESIYEYAEIIMNARQNGLPKVEITASLPSGGNSDILQASFEYRVVEQAPTLVRKPVI